MHIQCGNIKSVIHAYKSFGKSSIIKINSENSTKYKYQSLHYTVSVYVAVAR